MHRLLRSKPFPPLSERHPLLVPSGTVVSRFDRVRATALVAIALGAWLFAPATALNVIHHGCELALRSSSHASALSALRAAGGSMEKVTRYGD